MNMLITSQYLHNNSDGGGNGESGDGEKWIDDGNTHIWITLEDGRTSPILGVCPNGTVTVDWGDGTTPDILTGSSTYLVKWTPTHNYAAAGDYVITLTVDGVMGFYGMTGSLSGAGILNYSSDQDRRNNVYRCAIKKIEIGNSVPETGQYAFYNCHSLSSIKISDGVNKISGGAFTYCYALSSVVGAKSTQLGSYAFRSCYSLSSIIIPDGVTRLPDMLFYECYSLSSVTIPESVTYIAPQAFQKCYSLSSVEIPSSLTSVESQLFEDCYGLRYVDFTKHTSVPSLRATSAFKNIPKDCEIRVPAALYDQWIAATNWSSIASNIVAV